MCLHLLLLLSLAEIVLSSNLRETTVSTGQISAATFTRSGFFVQETFLDDKNCNSTKANTYFAIWRPLGQCFSHPGYHSSNYAVTNKSIISVRTNVYYNDDGLCTGSVQYTDEIDFAPSSCSISNGGVSSTKGSLLTNTPSAASYNYGNKIRYFSLKI